VIFLRELAALPYFFFRKLRIQQGVVDHARDIKGGQSFHNLKLL
jgi:hypothetical protein